MGKWKTDAKEFSVKVSYVENRGYQMYFPKPLMERFGAPERVVFRVKRTRVEVAPEDSGTEPSPKKGRGHAGGAS